MARRRLPRRPAQGGRSPGRRRSRLAATAHPARPVALPFGWPGATQDAPITHLGKPSGRDDWLAFRDAGKERGRYEEFAPDDLGC